MPAGCDDHTASGVEDAVASRPVYPKPSAWTQEHRRWLAAQQFEQPISELTYADLVASVDGLTARMKALAERIGELALDEQWWPTVVRLRAFRGVNTLTAFAIHLELGADWERFQKAHRVGSWLGLAPSRTQSGESDRQGAITKTGSVLARRLLIESAWHYARVGATLTNRHERQPDHILQIANRAQLRLHRVYTRMRARGEPHNVTVVACARELAWFLWAAATAPPTSRASPRQQQHPGSGGRDAGPNIAAGTRDASMSNTFLV